MISESDVHLSDITFQAEALDTVSQISSPLISLVTVFSPFSLYVQVAKIGLHLALILGAAHINVLAAAYVHALVVDADLVEVAPVDGKQPPGNGGRVQGLRKWLWLWQ